MIRTVGLFLILMAVVGGVYLGARSWLTPPVQEVSELPEMEPAVVEDIGPRVLVAKRRLDAGTLIKPADLRWLEWPPDKRLEEHYLVEGDATRESFEGTVVRSWLAEGEPVTEAHLVQRGERGFLSAVLEPGYRAVTIDTKEAQALAGLAFPGDRVDLILSCDPSKERRKEQGGEGSAQERYKTRTLLTDIRVLAINDSIKRQMDSEPAEKLSVTKIKTVTLEVMPEQAEDVVRAAKLGTLSVALRGIPPEGTMSGEYSTISPDVRVSLCSQEPIPMPRVEVVHGVEVVRGMGSPMEGFEGDDE